MYAEPESDHARLHRVQDVADVDPLKPQITNSVEFGYKGFLANRTSVGIDVYYSRIENFLSPIAGGDPERVPRSRAARRVPRELHVAGQAAQLAAAIAGIDGSSAATGIPLATVTPDPTPSGIRTTSFSRAGTSDEVHLWGVDFGATVIVSDQLSFTGTYSFVNPTSSAVWEASPISP